MHLIQVHDRMTEEVYHQPLQSFKTDVTPAPVYTVPLLERGRPALEEINEELGLGFDEWDKDYYLHMFTEDLKRDPTSVELFDMAQSNSEHRCPFLACQKYILQLSNTVQKIILQKLEREFSIAGKGLPFSMSNALN